MKSTSLCNAKEAGIELAQPFFADRRSDLRSADPRWLFESDTKKGAWKLHWTRRMKQDGEA
jgi:hypothetical protein